VILKASWVIEKSGRDGRQFFSQRKGGYMGRKTFSLIIMGILLIAFILVPLSRVKAQSIVIIVLAVIGLAQNEKAEVYWHQTPNPPDHQPTDRVVFNYNYFFNVTKTWPTTSSGEEACTEAVQTTVNGRAGINVLTLEMGAGNDSLLVNGEEVPLMESCFEDAKRVVFEVGIQHPHSSQTSSLNPDTIPAGSPKFLGATVIRDGGETAASVNYGIPGGDFINRFTVDSRPEF
jgi:hypothetical protein